MTKNFIKKGIFFNHHLGLLCVAASGMDTTLLILTGKNVFNGMPANYKSKKAVD